MITRRTLLISGLAVGASAFAGDHLVVAKRKKKRRDVRIQYAAIARNLVFGPNIIDLPVDFYLFATAHETDFHHLTKCRRPIEIAVPYSLGDWYPTSPLYQAPYKDRFNIAGYRYVRRKRYGVKVPITGQPSRRVRIRMRVAQAGFSTPLFPDVTAPSGTFSGTGKPGRWIWLRPVGKRR